MKLYTKQNISSVKHCYGCGVCAISCPKHIIRMQLDKNGFWAPIIDDSENCTNCGECVRSCAWMKNQVSLCEKPIASYAAYSKDNNIRTVCSSGGIAYEICKKLIQENYKICAVRYNSERQRAEHYFALTEEDLIDSIGSKYLPSYTLEGFSAINVSEKNLIIATPCHIDSLRNYIRRRRKEDNFILIDFFCHGVPSMNLWKRYVKEVEKKIGIVRFASWRSKQNGWNDSWVIALDGEDYKGNVLGLEKKKMTCSHISMRSDNDPFYYMFLSNSCLNKNCYKACKYKYDNSAADIRIGDLWGSLYADDKEGVSAAVAFTEKGKKILENTHCVLKKHDFSIVAEGQMRQCPKRPNTYYLLKLLMHIPLLSLKNMREIMVKTEIAEFFIHKFLRIRK